MTTSQTQQAGRPSAAYGVHSEVGRLRKVLVCAPGLAHQRLTPTNSDALLFDELLRHFSVPGQFLLPDEPDDGGGDAA